MADNNILGRGKLLFGKYITGTSTPAGELYFGNTPEFKLSIESQSLDHYSSDQGVKEKDNSVVLQTDRKATLSCDNISPANLALMFLGINSIQSQVATPVTAETVVAVGVSDAWYQLGTTDANPSGVRRVSAFTLKDNTPVTPIVYVLNVDYEVDLELGRFRVIPGGSAVGDTLVAAYTPAAVSRARVLSRGDSIEGSLRFLAYNPAGDQFDYFMPRVKLTPNGDFDLKGDEWQIMSFNVEILKKGTLEAIYIDGRPYVTV